MSFTAYETVRRHLEIALLVTVQLPSAPVVHEPDDEPRDQSPETLAPATGT